MIDTIHVREFISKFSDIIEKKHFERDSFVVNKKIFLTMDSKKNIIVVKLNLEEQSIFINQANKSIYPVKGAWGLKGYTEIDLNIVQLEVLEEAIRESYEYVSFKKKK